MINVKNLTKSFHDHVILKQINFNIQQGQCVALIGNNGAGKTTLMKCLLGETSVQQGEIIFNHQTLNQSQFNNIVGVLPQQNALPENLTVQELIDFYRTIYKQPLTLTQINDLLLFSPQQYKQLIGQLSGGQRRLLSFVLILIGQPQLLFLDEPTVSMDTATRLRFWKIISELKEQGVTILYTSHYIEEIEYTADRILVLQQGELIHNTTVYALKEQQRFKKVTIPRKFYSEIANSELVQNVLIKADYIQFSTCHLEPVYQLLLQAGCSLDEITISQQTLLSRLFEESEETIA